MLAQKNNCLFKLYFLIHINSDVYPDPEVYYEEKRRQPNIFFGFFFVGNRIFQSEPKKLLISKG